MVASMVMRFALVALVVGVLALLVVAPWKRPPSLADEASDKTVARLDEGAMQPVPGFDTAADHELVRYEMPKPADRPPLPAGTKDLIWEDLWAEGTMQIDDTERVGAPTAAEFPDGTTQNDIDLFFLDIADMRSLQPQIGDVKASLDGKRVRIAGYTTPVGFSEKETAFLLVPELGACIHVPPPPANQIVYVPKVAGEPEMFAPVWVTGTLRADPVATILADVGYRLDDAVAVPYR